MCVFRNQELPFCTAVLQQMGEVPGGQMQTLDQELHYDSEVNEERIYSRYLNVFSRTVEVSQLAKIRIHQFAFKLAPIFADNSDAWLEPAFTWETCSGCTVKTPDQISEMPCAGCWTDHIKQPF